MSSFFFFFDKWLIMSSKEGKIFFKTICTLSKRKLKNMNAIHKLAFPGNKILKRFQQLLPII